MKAISTQVRLTSLLLAVLTSATVLGATVQLHYHGFANTIATSLTNRESFPCST